MWDVRRLSTILFGMGFEQDFLSKCEFFYGWYFAHLFPALYDGSFYQDSLRGKARGQEHLLGFATFLCGVFLGNDQYRTNLNYIFEKSLLDDGYQFVGGKLVETDVDTDVSPELAALPNRTALIQDLSTGIQSGDPVSVFFLDLDHFKEVNDCLGHAAGNECLTRIVQTIAQALRRKGKLYRVGGDEFCVVLPNFVTPEATVTAERVRVAVEELKAFGGIVKVTASIGVAGSDRNPQATPDWLVAAADDAMYVAKFTGKNRVSTWPLNPEETARAQARRKTVLGR